MQQIKIVVVTFLDFVEEAVVKYDYDGCFQYYNDMTCTWTFCENKIK